MRKTEDLHINSLKFLDNTAEDYFNRFKAEDKAFMRKYNDYREYLDSMSRDIRKKYIDGKKLPEMGYYSHDIDFLTTEIVKRVFELVLHEEET